MSHPVTDPDYPPGPILQPRGLADLNVFEYCIVCGRVVRVMAFKGTGRCSNLCAQARTVRGSM